MSFPLIASERSVVGCGRASLTLTPCPTPGLLIEYRWKTNKAAESHFLDLTSDGGVGEQCLGRQALESNGLGSDPGRVTLGQLQSLCASVDSLFVKGR